VQLCYKYDQNSIEDAPEMQTYVCRVNVYVLMMEHCWPHQGQQWSCRSIGVQVVILCNCQYQMHDFRKNSGG